MPANNHRIIKLTIECIELPSPNWGGHPQIWLGIQQGTEVVQEVRLPAESATFEAELRVSENSEQPSPNFLGPYAQGPAHDRFVYLCWGYRIAGQWAGFRRAKLKLTNLGWDDIASDRLHATVRCTDTKGGPICATLRNEYVTWSSPSE